MANDDALRRPGGRLGGRPAERGVADAAARATYAKGLDSEVADLANVAAGTRGGMRSRRCSCEEFVPDGVRWAHLDIAGPAFNEGEPHGYTPKGGTGAADQDPRADRAGRRGGKAVAGARC